MSLSTFGSDSHLFHYFKSHCLNAIHCRYPIKYLPLKPFVLPIVFTETVVHYILVQMDPIDLLKIAELDFNEFENMIVENPNLITTKDVNDRLLIHWLDWWTGGGRTFH